MNFKKYIIILFSVVFLSGCVSQENYLIKNINFDNYKSINVDASNLIIDYLYTSNIAYPFIDHLVKQNLISLINEWALARLKPVKVNNTGNLKVIVNNASIKAFLINQNAKIEEFFVSNAAIKIEMNLDITIDLLDENANRISYVDIKVFKSQELGDNISLLEKDYLIQEMSRSLIKDFDSLAINKLKEIFYKSLLPN
ncbi:MAG TPA: hypothetical protein EYQ51_04680 [Alphaproteobacteria bacterium]|nr:hypothetical protein [Alphaproteobacteria bacterium]